MLMLMSTVPGLLVLVTMSGKSLEEVNLTLLEDNEGSDGCLVISCHGTSSGAKAGVEAELESGLGVAVDLFEAPLGEALGAVSTAKDFGDMDWHMGSHMAVRVTAPMTFRRDLL
mmetsp:Transcript_60773/g.130578  ORF Transcript_60773/g.130578 Transcript_60773/m.130578 type:complete len:114 (+) Transcript_60773:368-709(+)